MGTETKYKIGDRVKVLNEFQDAIIEDIYVSIESGEIYYKVLFGLKGALIPEIAIEKKADENKD
jgi:hypothetical protein